MAGLAMSPSRLRQGRGRPVKPSARTCVSVLHKRERQLAGPWPDWPSRLLAFGKGGKVPAKPPPRTCVIVLHKRERQLAAPWRESSSPVTDREETAQALGLHFFK